MSRYMTGYNGSTRTLAQLQAWDQWQHLDPEYQRRALWLLDASIANGTPVGIGGIWRSDATQLYGALSRHVEVASGGCCSYNGKRYAKKPGVAHMTFPPFSYHLTTTPAGHCLAIDWMGNLKWLAANVSKVGLKTFADVNNEPWHCQPVSIPNGKAQYNPAKHHPLPVIPLPGIGTQQPVTIVEAPQPTLRVGSTTNNVIECRELQVMLNFLGYTDQYGMKLLVDGDYGLKTASAVRKLQTALKIVVDGVYGPQSAKALQALLDHMAVAK